MKESFTRGNKGKATSKGRKASTGATKEESFPRGNKERKLN